MIRKAGKKREEKFIGFFSVDEKTDETFNEKAFRLLVNIPGSGLVS